jgi:hypothetical protein
MRKFILIITAVSVLGIPAMAAAKPAPHCVTAKQSAVNKKWNHKHRHHRQRVTRVCRKVKIPTPISQLPPPAAPVPAPAAPVLTTPQAQNAAQGYALDNWSPSALMPPYSGAPDALQTAQAACTATSASAQSCLVIGTAPGAVCTGTIDVSEDPAGNITAADQTVAGTTYAAISCS